MASDSLPPSGYPYYGAEPYFQFEVDSSQFTDLQITFDVDIEGNWANSSDNHICSWSNANGGAYDGTPRLDFTPVTKNTWYAARTATASTAGPSSTIGFRINEIGAKPTGTDPRVVLDNVVLTGCGVPVPPTIAKAFSPDPVAVNSVSTLTFTLSNENNVTLGGVTFTDSLPTGLQVAATPAASTTCGGSPKWSPSAGETTLTFGSPTGATIPARVGTMNGTCTAQVDVTATTAGPHPNVSGYVSYLSGGTTVANYGPGGSATASLTAVLPPSIAKGFSPDPILAGGTSTLTFTLTNPNPNNALSGVAFSDPFPVAPGAMTVAAPLATSNTCGGSLLDNLGGALAAGDAAIRLL